MTDETRRTDGAGETVEREERMAQDIPEAASGIEWDEQEDREEQEKRKEREAKTRKRKKPGRGRKGPKWKRWLRRILTVLAVLLVLSGIGYLIVTHTSFYKELQETAYDTLATMDKGTFRKLGNTKILDGKGNVIGEVDSGSYEYREISDIPLDLQNAYIAAEDQNFKTHHGVDYKATLRAALALVKNGGEITQGGSTITQQVIKNNLLSQEQSFLRKFLEILMAPELEKKYSKQEIMEFYCNSNYYGNGCYGVGSAARFYFGKDVTELTTAECAMLAGVSNSPNNYNPVASMELATKKKNSILNKMQECGFLTEEECKKAKEQEITVTQTETSLLSSSNYMCSYAMHCAALKLMEQDGFEFRYLFDSEEDYEQYDAAYTDSYKKMASLIRGGGYTIQTSFDTGIQEKLQASVDQSLSGSKETQENGKYALQGAAVCIDNETGYIVAMVGGRGEDQFNRAFLSERQPGSTIKPLLVYGPAFDRGIAVPSSIYTDKKVTVSGYSPKNANNRYLGAMNLRKALALSTNTVAFQVFREVGQENALKYLEQMKFSSIRYADNSAMSIALGGFTYGVKVDEMARAYAAIQNHGSYRNQTCLVKITHETEGTVYDGKEKPVQVYSEDAAFMLTDTMEGVLEESYGTGANIDLKGQIAAGKTGTTNSNRDVWFCGYTNYYTASVWVGRDDNGVLSRTDYANRIWESFMNQVHQGKAASDFQVPDTIEYRNVLSGGKLGSRKAGNLDMGKRSYLRRPAGYDLYSSQNAKKLKKHQEEKELKEALENAEAKVAAFEAYEITSVATAKGMDSAYASAVEAVEAIPDPEKQPSFKTRVAEKYEKLQKTYQEWETKIEEADAEAAKQAAAERDAKDEANQAAATEKLHKQRVSNMEWYLDELADRDYNTDTAKRLLQDAANALENCREYEEYKSLQQRYEEQTARIQGLPTEVPTPEVPENRYDTIEDDYPDDEVPEADSSASDGPDSTEEQE